MNTLNKERSEELAKLTGKLVEDQPKPTEYIYGIAKSLMGKR
jgi:hypothetical protein